MAAVLHCNEPTADYNITNTSRMTSLYYDYYYYYSNDLPVGYAFILYLANEIFPLIVVSVAIFGNITIIVTLMTKKNRRFSTASFFVSLAVSDLLAAVASPLLSWISAKVGTKTWNMDIDCKIIPVLVYASKNISSICLAVITTERAICVYFPHKVKLICSPKVAKSFLIVIWISNFVFYSFTGIYGNPYIEQGYVHCENSSIFFGHIFPWVNLSLEFIVPFIVIFTGSLIIINKMYIRSKKSVATKRTQHLKSLSFTLITTNIIFILTTLPWSVYSLYDLIRQLINPCWKRDIETNHFLMSILISINDLNHALNFFIYFLSGSQFRNDVKTLMSGLFKNARH